MMIQLGATKKSLLETPNFYHVTMVDGAYLGRVFKEHFGNF